MVLNHKCGKAFFLQRFLDPEHLQMIEFPITWCQSNSSSSSNNYKSANRDPQIDGYGSCKPNWKTIRCDKPSGSQVAPVVDYQCIDSNDSTLNCQRKQQGASSAPNGWCYFVVV